MSSRTKCNGSGLVAFPKSKLSAQEHGVQRMPGGDIVPHAHAAPPTGQERPVSGEFALLMGCLVILSVVTCNICNRHSQLNDNKE